MRSINVDKNHYATMTAAKVNSTFLLDSDNMQSGLQSSPPIHSRSTEKQPALYLSRVTENTAAQSSNFDKLQS